MRNAVCSSLAVVFLLWSGACLAEGNLASRPVHLPPLVLKEDLSISVKEYRITTGKYYRWTIESKGGEEFQILAPELFRNSWIDQVVINDIEVKPAGGIYSVEFDEAGTADIWFVTLRPGDYEFFVAGHRERGMLGKFVAR